MAHSTYPASSDLSALITSLGLVPSPNLTGFLAGCDLAGKCSAASTEWEGISGYTPFLAGGSDTVRRFDPPRRGQRLHLDGGIISLTELRVNLSPTDAGNVLIADTDFFLEPYNAPARLQPYDQIRFWAYPFSIASGVGWLPKSIQVTGRWGYWSTVPDDAWQAILRYALALTYDEIAGQANRGLKEAQELRDRVQFRDFRPDADKFIQDFATQAQQFVGISL